MKKGSARADVTSTQPLQVLPVALELFAMLPAPGQIFMRQLEAATRRRGHKAVPLRPSPRPQFLELNCRPLLFCKEIHLGPQHQDLNRVTVHRLFSAPRSP